MEKKIRIRYEDTPFLKTSNISAYSNRLNWRCEILLTRNQEAIKDKKILDLASHDGRFSYACLKLGAKHVTGVEGRHHLVEYARENIVNLGYKPQNFTVIQEDVFNYLPTVKPGEFDTILCLGFFYHTIKQIELLSEIIRIQPKYFILDTKVVKVLVGNKKFFRKLIKKNKLKYFRQILTSLNKLTAIFDNKKACLVFKYEGSMREGNTIDPINLVAWPTKSFIELLFRTYGLDFKQLHWRNKKEIKDWSNLEGYKSGARISYIAKLF